MNIHILAFSASSDNARFTIIEKTPFVAVNGVFFKVNLN